MRPLLRQTLSNRRNPVRRALGLLSLFVGILGVILPIIPGWPGFVLAIVLLGRRDRTVRHTFLLGRRLLRTLRRARHPHLRQIGQRLSAEFVRGRRMLEPAIARAERLFGAA
jgi:hypothetical protein